SIILSEKGVPLRRRSGVPFERRLTEMGQYCDSDWHSIKKPGWICSTFGEFVGSKHDPFTHWMPVPGGPAVDEAT
uniref:hypothetical protein n=1 Tax=Sphingobium xenophagum TaxID=121428 RepID=UPI0019D6D3DB